MANWPTPTICLSVVTVCEFGQRGIVKHRDTESFRPNPFAPCPFAQMLIDGLARRLDHRAKLYLLDAEHAIDRLGLLIKAENRASKSRWHAEEDGFCDLMIRPDQFG